MDHSDQGQGRPQPAREPAELVIREPEDLLGYIPHAMGEWPSESLVAVTVGSGTVGVTVRVDLPPRDGGDLAAYAEAVCGYLSTDPLADGAVLVVYTAQPWAEAANPPRHGLVTELQAALARAGLPVLDAWLVGERHWRSMLCSRSSCCPWPGERVETITASRLGTELVYRGSTFEAPAGGGPLRAALPGGGSPSRGSSAGARPADHYGVHTRSWWDPCEFAAALAAWEDTLGDSRAPGPERLSLLAASLARPALRDAVIVAAALGGRAAWVGTLENGKKYDRDLRSANGAAGRSARPSGADLGEQMLRGLPELPELPGGLTAREARQILAAWSAHTERVDNPKSVDVETGCDELEGANPELEGANPELEGVNPGRDGLDSAGLEEAALAFGGVLLGSTPEPPSWERIGRLERVLRAMTSMEAPEVRAPALAMLGWIHWVRGRGAKAVGFLRRALSAAPDYRFAELFLALVESGELAAWARRPETAWRRLSDVA
ncbi:DUF4192 family protein [Sinomonas albida]|uniref:DUF4192 family protein n=1 Tax=Sinomonas albida TaxID=369942 RepID=UPI001457D590|nr:DUF4192 family protein [Sinomonas albida]